MTTTSIARTPAIKKHTGQITGLRYFAWAAVADGLHEALRQRLLDNPLQGWQRLPG